MSEELKTRRDFFKRSAQVILPMIGALVVSANPIFAKSSSCEDMIQPAGCNRQSPCTGSCYQGCSGSYRGSCVGDCTGRCTNTCKGSCSGRCYNSCSGNCSGTCEQNCSGNCYWGCQTTCNRSCYDLCKDGSY